MSRRQSHCIRRQQATNTNPAIRLAEKLGYPLNLFVTLTFGGNPGLPLCAGTEFAGIRDRFGKWVRRPVKARAGFAAPPTFYWVLENTGVVAAHWVVHVPPCRQADFIERLPIWMAEFTNRPLADDAIDVKPVRNIAGLRKYTLKGLDPLYADLYRIEAIPQGLIYGKRFGFSRNLGPSQCKLHGTRRRHYGSIAPWAYAPQRAG